jgi:predicted enzyme related to lactoylglutathione lyase
MTPVVWWEVETPRVDEFQAFHGAMWGWQFRSAFQDSELGRDYWLILAEGKGIGGLQRALTADPPRAGVRLYLEVDDLEASIDLAVSLGAAVERGRTELGGDDRWFANLLDPAGVSIGLWTAAPVRPGWSAPPAG